MEDRHSNIENAAQAALDATLFLFSYNQASFIEDACLAALAQTDCRLEIIISDDCSSDETFLIIQRVTSGYTGPHKVVLNRNDQNLGLISHVNLAFRISSCKLIIVAAGDDISEPYRASSLIEVWSSSSKKPLLLHSSVTKIDEHGNVMEVWRPPLVTCPRTLTEIAVSFELYIGASGAWDKDLFSRYGAISELGAWEDQVLGFRAALTDSIRYIDQPLVKYRVNVGMSAKSGQVSLIFAHRVQSARSRIRRQLSVFQQRRIDTKFAYRNHDAIELSIDNAVKLLCIRLEFYDRPLTYIVKCITSPYTYLQIAFEELKYMASIRRRLKRARAALPL